MANDFIPKEGKGSLWKNDNPKSERSPQYTGNAMYEGKLIRFTGFINEAKSGKKYIGLNLSPADEQSSERRPDPKEDDGWL
jgi:hypothetical protein